MRDLIEWLRMPSISTGAVNRVGLEQAAEWVANRIRRTGACAEVVRTDGNPLVVGHLAATRADAPTILLYGHYDVQDVGEATEWVSPPFEPEVRGERLYGRGAADDKGNFLPLLIAACELYAAGALAVNVRVLVEGEEEVDSASVIDWVNHATEQIDAAVVFDAAAVDEHTAAITVAMRGLLTTDVTVRTGTSDLHSGLYGGVARNALHVLTELLASVIPRGDGRLPASLREGVRAPSEEEIASWRALPPGGETLTRAGALPIDAHAPAQFYPRTWAGPSLDVNHVEGGQPRTMIPCEARARLTMRLAPGQAASSIAQNLERLLLERASEGVAVSVATDASEPILLEPRSPAIMIAREAFTAALGRPPALVRSGGSIPIVAALFRRGVPAIVSGFSLPQDAIHGPNESFRLAALDDGLGVARALLDALAHLPR